MALDPNKNADRFLMTRDDWVVWFQDEAAWYAERARNYFFPAHARISYADSAADLYRRARETMSADPAHF